MTRLARPDLDAAVAAGIITTAQADQLAAFYGSTPETAAPAPVPAPASPRFTFVNVLYYLGGMIAIGAMSLFMTLGWNTAGGWGGFTIAVCYGLLAVALTKWFLEVKALPVPAGIMGTLAVTMVPLAIFFAQMALGYWDDHKSYRDYHLFIDWRWIMMELGTLAAGSVLLWRFRFPFMLMPIAITLWYMSMDLAPFLFGESAAYAWELRKFISVCFGGLMVLLAFWVDIRSRRSQDYAFWLYLFGVTAFWGGLSLMGSNSELGKLGYCGLNVLMIFIGAVLNRRVFAVFGGFGVAGYLGYLSQRIFRDSLLFPLALSAIGLAIVWLGVLWQRHEQAWSAKLRAGLPAALRELIEARARD